MATRVVAVFTCDRCSRSVQTQSSGHVPSGWSQAVIKPLDADEVGLLVADLCDGCSDQTIRFIQNGRDDHAPDQPARPVEGD